MHCASLVSAITHFILGKSVNPVFGEKVLQAGYQNRTDDRGLENRCFAIKLIPLEILLLTFGAPQETRTLRGQNWWAISDSNRETTRSKRARYTNSLQLPNKSIKPLPENNLSLNSLCIPFHHLGILF
jgi:hypothetical protein